MKQEKTRIMPTLYDVSLFFLYYEYKHQKNTK